MKRALFLAAALFTVGCYQSTDTDLPMQGNPPPNAAGGVTVPADVVPWTSDKCMVDTDCAGTAGIGECQKAVCEAGACIAVNALPGAACTAADLATCQAGVCKVGDEGKLACVVSVAQDGTVCGEFYAACGGAAYCVNGLCVDPCDDGNACTADKCTDAGCTATPQTGACDDGNPCTENDACKDGACKGEKVCDCTKDGDCFDLEDGDLCNGTLECKEGACVVKKSTVVKCPETGSEPCQFNACVPETGKCELTVAEDNTECDDAAECTDDTFCLVGACTGIGSYSCEVACDDTLDEDEDGLADCQDAECFGIGECPTPACDDGECQDFAGETCATCPEDCGKCPPECGDGELTVETGEECDDKNKTNGDGCDEACKVEPAAAEPGDVIVTEIMKNPELVDDSAGEWFELLNTTDQDIDINAWTIKDAGTDFHRIFALGGVVIPAGAYVVLAVNADEKTNGGIIPDYVYEGFVLGNKEDEVVLSSGETVVDQVVYTDGAPFPVGDGASLSLSPSKLDATDNDAGENWCDGQVPYGLGDLGTPGVVNTECPACGDTICNGEETCADCDDCKCAEGSKCVGKECVELKKAGESCMAKEDCATGFCVDGVCCLTACTGLCESCAKAGAAGTCSKLALGSDPQDECGLCKTCDGNGACTAILAGDDPDNDCTEAAKNTCGLSGTCDGKGACAFWDVTTECLAAACTVSDFNAADKCDGKGACVADATKTSCCPFKCDVAGKACETTCATDNDCCATAFCATQKVCKNKKPTGQNCQGNSDCISGKCTGGKCE
jgi:hypothetical protein